jgi:pantoate--beta-alanine ligase
MRALLATEPDVRVEYVVLADPDSLDEVARIDGPTVALIAAFVGNTRLIDNQLLGANPETGVRASASALCSKGDHA